MLYKKTLLLLLAAVAVAAVIATAGSRGQSRQTKDSPALEKAKEDFYTVTNYNAPEPADPRERARLRARKNRYKIPPSPNVDPKQFAITERRESSFGLPPSHAPIEPAIPAAKSDAVVIGSVGDARAHLTADDTDIFSEFEIRLEDVLKSAAPLSVGDSVTAVRGGGGVSFPSGKVVLTGGDGKPLPRVGRRYLFFLKYNDDAGEDYSIITAYELRGGRVLPLDGVGLDDEVVFYYAAYQKFKDADEATFLKQVREAVDAQSLTATAVANRPTLTPSTAGTLRGRATTSGFSRPGSTTQPPSISRSPPARPRPARRVTSTTRRPASAGASTITITRAKTSPGRAPS